MKSDLEDFKKSVYAIIYNSNLKIDGIYYVLKDIYKEISDSYVNFLNSPDIETTEEIEIPLEIIEDKMTAETREKWEKYKKENIKNKKEELEKLKQEINEAYDNFNEQLKENNIEE